MNANGSGESHPTCQTCRHWRQLPINPQNIGAVRPGFCVESRPVPLVVGVSAEGQAVINSVQPMTKPDEGCDKHQPVGNRILGGMA